MREGHCTPHIFFRALVDSRFSSEYRKSLPEPINSTFNSWNIMVERTEEVFLFLYHSLACTFPFFLIFPIPFPSHIYHTPYFPLFLFIFPSSFCPFISHSPFPSTFLRSNTIYAIFLYCQFPFSFSFPSLVPFKCTLVSLLTLCIIKKCDYLNVKVQASLKDKILTHINEMLRLGKICIALK